MIGCVLPVTQGHTACAEHLLRRGAKGDIVDDCGCSAIWLAAGHGHLDCMRALLHHGSCRALFDLPANASSRECRGRTPLLSASARGHIEACCPVPSRICGLPLPLVIERFASGGRATNGTRQLL